MEQQPSRFSDLGIVSTHRKFVGDKIKLHKVLNKEIWIYFYEINPSKYPKKDNEDCLWIQISVEGKKYLAFSIAKGLMKTIQEIPKDRFPIITTIINDNELYEFT